jgi:hypothetical protein
VPIEAGTRRQCTRDPHHKEYPRTDPVVCHAALNVPLNVLAIVVKQCIFANEKHEPPVQPELVEVSICLSLPLPGNGVDVLNLALIAVFVLFTCQQEA